VRTAQVDLAGGQEDVDAFDVDQETTFDLALDFAVDLVALVVLVEDSVPCGQAIGAALAEHGRVGVVETGVVDVVDLARLGQVLAELGEADRAFRLAADVEDDKASALVDRVDGGLDDAIDRDALDRSTELFVESFGGDPAEDVFDLPVQESGVKLELPDAS